MCLPVAVCVPRSLVLSLCLCVKTSASVIDQEPVRSILCSIPWITRYHSTSTITVSFYVASLLAGRLGLVLEPAAAMCVTVN